MMNYTENYYTRLVQELCNLPHESEWLEFKKNRANAEEIGEYISALSNSAALIGRKKAYLVWGIDDETHQIIGTSFRPQEIKIGNEDLDLWLAKLFQPRINFHFREIYIDDKFVVLLEIDTPFTQPVSFKNTEYIRIGSSKRRLKDYPEKERVIWRCFETECFEKRIAMPHVTDKEVLDLIDHASYFDLLSLSSPEDKNTILSFLTKDDLIAPCEAGGWDITNLGALLFARRIDVFPSIKRKAMRVIQYRGRGRSHTIREQVGTKGYISGFEGLLAYIGLLTPTNEIIEKALRRSVPLFPEIAVRELVANALIHQNLFETGTGPMVEIFDDRMEITNPGEPLVDILRFLDSPPKSRNETLASLMRRFGICEERGSGIDKVVEAAEAYQLPAPSFETIEGFTRSVLFAHKPLRDMDKGEREPVICMPV